jgi:hypothetical protein
MRGFGNMQVWHDEWNRYERTGRLDQGPCWCNECLDDEEHRRDPRS